MNAYGDSSSSNYSPLSVAEIKATQCGTAADMGMTNTKDVTGKIIKKVGDGAEVRIWHSLDVTKLACMSMGKE